MAGQRHLAHGLRVQGNEEDCVAGPQWVTRDQKKPKQTDGRTYWKNWRDGPFRGSEEFRASVTDATHGP